MIRIVSVRSSATRRHNTTRHTILLSISHENIILWIIIFDDLCIEYGPNSVGPIVCKTAGEKKKRGGGANLLAQLVRKSSNARTESVPVSFNNTSTITNVPPCFDLERPLSQCVCVCVWAFRPVLVWKIAGNWCFIRQSLSYLHQSLSSKTSV